MEISPKAWRAYQDLKGLLRDTSIKELSTIVKDHVMPEQTKDMMREKLTVGAYENWFDWEALEIMEGMLELLIAIQTMKNDGTITVKEDQYGDIEAAE